MSAAAPILSEGAGYGVVLGIGLSFSGLMMLLTFFQNRYTQYQQSATEFTSASHSVKPGLIASGIVSAWTWSATLLQSSAVAYEFGVSGAWWYAAGATVQVLLFAQNAAKLKMNAPGAHTFLEVIAKRWGKTAHCTFMFFGLATNVIISSMLITGGSDTVTNLTGMPTPIACVCIVIPVVLYILLGGMRASLLADYIHTAALYAIIIAFMIVVYGTSDKIGSPGAMYDMLAAVSDVTPVPGNAGGSYLTMRSRSGLIFAVINIVGNFSVIFNDQSYWQRGSASKPETCVKGFLLGGVAWTSIPLGIASSLGLGAVVLTSNPSFPGYPNFLTAEQIIAGIPAPAAASALLGSTGAIVMLILLFLAVTSASSAQLVAVSSIITYDVYTPYWNPTATDEQKLKVDRLSVLGFGVVQIILGIVFWKIGIGMGWIYEFMGVVLGGSVFPVALAITSERGNKMGCLWACWIGLISGLLTWLIVAGKLFGGINIDSTGQDYSMLAGNLAGIGSSAIVSLTTSYIWPENYDFIPTRMIGRTPMDVLSIDEASDVEIVTSVPSSIDVTSDDEKKITDSKVSTLPVGSASSSIVPVFDDIDMVELQKAYLLAVRASVVLFLVLIVLIPLPLFFSSYVYSKTGFTVYISTCFIWIFAGAAAVVLYPIYESREALVEIGTSIVRDVFGGGIRGIKAEQE